MNKTMPFLLLIQFLLVSCAAKTDISHDPRFKNLVGHSIRTRVPLKLYEIDYQLSGYKDRYDFGGEVLGHPLVGIVPAGHSVFFERAVRRNGPDVQIEHLEGVIEFRGKSYPIDYYLGLTGGDINNFWKSLRYNFVFP